MAIKQFFPFVDSIYALEKIRPHSGAVDSKNVAAIFFDHQTASTVNFKTISGKEHNGKR